MDWSGLVHKYVDLTIPRIIFSYPEEDESVITPLDVALNSLSFSLINKVLYCK